MYKPEISPFKGLPVPVYDSLLSSPRSRSFQSLNKDSCDNSDASWSCWCKMPAD